MLKNTNGQRSSRYVQRNTAVFVFGDALINASVEQKPTRNAKNNSPGRCAHSCDVINGQLYSFGGGDGHAVCSVCDAASMCHRQDFTLLCSLVVQRCLDC